MSAHKRTLRISPRARQDFDDILLHTLQVWGEDQALVYKEALERAMDQLLDFPELGRPSPEFLSDSRRLVVRHHVIFYVAEAETIMIHGMVHERQMPTVSEFDTNGM